ncbi:MAG: hypothetical protein RI883_507 [Bacteroidota bacterium]
MKKYYDILGLPVGASTVEIRKSYRKLAMRYHPDKNPSPQAGIQFIAITNAYEILMGKKDIPSVNVTNSRQAVKVHVKKQEERLKDAKKRYYEQQLKEKQAEERFFKSLFIGRKWKIIKLNSIVGTILALLVITDFFLPHHYEQDKITHISVNNNFGTKGEFISLVRTQKNNDYWVKDTDGGKYEYYPDIFIEKTWIFHGSSRLISNQKIKYGFYSLHYTFYSISVFLIIVFFLPLFTRLYKRPTVTFTVCYYFSLYLSGILILLFLISNDRWAHLLTLGFL